MPLLEPIVRIRCAADDEPRCRAALARAGFEAVPSPSPGGAGGAIGGGDGRSPRWLAVRDASPDAVNEALAAGGARARAAVRARIGQLLGWLLDHEGRVAGRGANLTALVSRVLDEGGLAARYRPRAEAALLAAAAEAYEHLMATGAALLPWDRFVALFCEERRG